MKKSGRPGDVERALSRALNFVQAHRMRLFLDRIMRKLCDMEDTELSKYCLAVEEAADGTVTRRITARPFADLASALEKIQMLTYYALSDTASERVKRKESPPEECSAGEIHAAIAAAIAETGAKSPKEMGAVIKAAKAKLAGKTVDGKALSDLVRAALAKLAGAS